MFSHFAFVGILRFDGPHNFLLLRSTFALGFKVYFYVIYFKSLVTAWFLTETRQVFVSFTLEIHVGTERVFLSQ